LNENIPPDKRKITWPDIEDEVKEKAPKKDENFKLSGKWKKFKKEVDGFKVYSVDGDWIRTNLSIIFGHGGHGYVHEFIPHDEIWISTHHWEGCECNKGNSEVSKDYYDSCVIHEITEYHLMKTGDLTYWPAHQLSLETEKEADILPDSEI